MNYTLVEEKLGISFTQEVILLFADISFHPEEYNLRYLGPEEVIEVYAFLKEESNLSFELPVLPFLTDDNSNFIGVYCSGLFNGKIVYLDHEDLDLTPAFKSVGSFTNHLRFYKPEYIGEEKEYPKANNTDKEDYLLFLKSLDHYRNTEDEYTKMYWAFCTLNFIPNNETRILKEFLFSDNMWTQAKACEIIRLRKDFSFVEDLGRLIDFSSTQTNKNIAAITTIGELGTEESRNTLFNLIEEIEIGGYGLYLLNALEQCGVKTKKVPHPIKGWEYFFFNEGLGEWVQLK